MFLQEIFGLTASAVTSLSGAYQPGTDLGADISAFSVHSILGAGVALVVLALVAIITKHKFPDLKLPIFVLLVTIMLSPVLAIGSTTLYFNRHSESGGPVNRVAGIEFWACGNELELKDPNGFWSNKIGSATLYEQNDRQIHVNGPIIDKTDASLGKFMYEIGGAISPSGLVVPVNSNGQITENDIDGDGASDLYSYELNNFKVYDGDRTYLKFLNGDTCGGQEAYLQTFGYHFDSQNQTYSQKKVVDPTSYSIEDSATVPPGDCIIVEFDKSKAQTDKLCLNYGLHDSMRCQEFGVEPGKGGFCNSKQLNYPGVDPNADRLKSPQGDQGV